MLDPRWEGIAREVGRLYHSCTTSEGRIDIIADYVVRLLNESGPTPDAVDVATGCVCNSSTEYLKDGVWLCGYCHLPRH